MSSCSADEFTRLVEIMATLRGPDGAPGIASRRSTSLEPFVLEETYELLEAIDRHDHEALREELGDFLFEAVFLAQLEERGGTLLASPTRSSGCGQARAPASRTCSAATGRGAARHGDQVRRALGRNQGAGARRRPADAEDAAERHSGGAARAASRVPDQPRAASVGFDWASAGDVVGKIEEEVDEIARGRRARRRSTGERAEEEMGDLLFAIANLSRKLGIEPETALRKANDKFTAGSRRWKRGSTGGPQDDRMSLEELEAEWQRVKSEERFRRADRRTCEHPATHRRSRR